jgi:glucoamylase
MGFAMIALENFDDARQMATYLLATQQPDGSWSQNFYPDGESYWHGSQLDETGFPLLLVAKLYEMGELGNLRGIHEMVRQACKYLVSAGPVTLEDRWEESKGISIFALAVIIASIVGAAPLLKDEHERQYLLSYADYLNRRIEDWLYVEHTDLTRKYEVDGYYLRMATTSIFEGEHGKMRIANRNANIDVVDMVAVDYMYLPRLGLRQADDRRMRDTLKVVEGEVCVVTPAGPGFYRYPRDAYGEHDDGSPFDGTGRGRLWPLLTGERGHLAIALGEDPSAYLDAMCQMSNRAGLIPEQIWDAASIPEHHLFPGKPTGSATPLLWAHAEYLSLASALTTGKSIELLDAVQQRYGGRRPEPNVWHWRPDAPFGRLPRGIDLLIDLSSPFKIRYAMSPTHAARPEASSRLGLGRHGVRLPAASLGGRTIEFNITAEDGSTAAGFVQSSAV